MENNNITLRDKIAIEATKSYIISNKINIDFLHELKRAARMSDDMADEMLEIKNANA